MKKQIILLLCFSTNMAFAGAWDLVLLCEEARQARIEQDEASRRANDIPTMAKQEAQKRRRGQCEATHVWLKWFAIELGNELFRAKL